MRIGVDVRMIQTFPTGIGNFREHLVKALAALESDHEFVLIGNSGNKMEEWADAQLNFVFAPVRSRANSIWQHLLLPFELRRLNLDLFWTTPWGATLFLPCPYSLTIYDLIYRRYPQYASLKARLYEWLLSGPMARRAKLIFVTSDFVARDVREFLRVSGDKVMNIGGAVGEEYRVIEDKDYKRSILEKYGIQKPYLVYVGNMRPHKNLARLLEAFAKLKDLGSEEKTDVVAATHASPVLGRGMPRGYSSNLRLVVIGSVDARGRGQDSRNLLNLVGGLGIREDVKFLGRIADDREVAAIMNEAAALVHPSLHEGFGLTVLEAMSCGTPVVTSRTTSISEVAGEAAIYVDPEDVDDIARGISEILSSLDKPMHPKLRERCLEQAKKFSWSGVARHILFLTL